MRRARARRPRTGSARAGRPRRSPPRERGRAAASHACRPCRRGSGRARRCSAARAGRRARGARRRRAAARAGRAAAGCPPRDRAGRRRRRSACARGRSRARRRGRSRPPATGRTASARARRRRRPAATRPPVEPRERPRARRACAPPPGTRARRRARRRPTGGASSPQAFRTIVRSERARGDGPDPLLRAARRARGSARRAASRSPPRPGPDPRSRARAGALRRSRPSAARAPRTASAGRRRARRALAAEPVEAEEREQRAAERRLAEPRGLLERVRNAERAEHGLEGARQRSGDSQTIPIRSGGVSARTSARTSVGDQLDRSANPRSLEEVHRPVERFLESPPVGEELALEMHERGGHETMLDGRQLLDRARRQGGQVVDRSLEGGEGRPRRLVRDRDGDVRPRRERFDQRPLGTGQVLEAVREDGLPSPGLEVALEPLGGAAAQAVSIPETEPVELRAIRPGEPSELATDRARGRGAPTRARRLRTGAPRRIRSSPTTR